MAVVDPYILQTQGKEQWKPVGDYEIRPLQMWGKMKELRRKHAREIWDAKREGKITILGLLDQITALPMGLGDVVLFTLGPHFGRIMDNNLLAMQCCEATESRGFGPDTCATLRIQLGSIYMGFHNLARDGARVPLDLCLEVHVCMAQSKIAREMSDYYGIPYHMIEMPPFPTPQSQDFLVEQMDDAIRWMEKVTGRKYDDEKLIFHTYHEWRSRVLMARIFEQQKNIPAPLDQRMIGSLNVTVQVSKTCRPEVADFLQEFLDEVKDRVANKISALGVEKARLFQEGQWPQFACGNWAPGIILRLGVPYGAIFIGGRNTFNIYGAWEIDPEGHWRSIQTLEEMGVTLKDRGDALRALARLFTEYSPMIQECQLGPRFKHTLALVQDYKVDGAVFNLDRSCHGITPVMTECRQALQEMGVPSTCYEASFCDPRDFDRGKVTEQLESFFESLGLTKTPR